MQNYEELLNNRAGKTPVCIQGIYDMVYAEQINVCTINNFSKGIKLIDSAVISDGTRTMVLFKKIGEKEERLIPLSDVDPQLREVMVIGRRFRNQLRDEKTLENDYRHFGLENYRGRLFLERSLKLPSDGRKAGDLAEL